MDPIQRRLALIDRQLAGPDDIYKKLISTSPLGFCAAGLLAGILLQYAFDLSAAIWLTLLSITASATTLFFAIKRKISYPLLLLSACALICFICLGAIRLIRFKQPGTNYIRNLVGSERQLATIRGSILTDPYLNTKAQWKFARFSHCDPVSSFYLKLAQVKAVDGWKKISGTVRVRLDEPVLDLKAGDYIQAYCWLDRFKRATNPGQFDTARYLARKNIFIAASVQSRDGIKRLEDRPAGILTKIKNKLRRAAAQALLGNLPPQDQNAALLEALLLGRRGNISTETHRAFQRTGLLHFISLSGLHFGILLGIVWWLCKTAGLMKQARAAVCIITTVIFLLIVPARAPTYRAAVIAFVFCLSFFFRRKANPLNTLSLAAIILLLLRPTQLFEAGWQLSFAAVLGILLFTNKIKNHIHEKSDFRLLPDHTKQIPASLRLTKQLASKIIALFSVGLAAWLGGAGILLYHFHTITPLASVWTVLVFPFVALILTLGFLKIILFFLLPTISALLGIFVTALSAVLIGAVKLIDHLDISSILIGRVSLLPIFLYYSAIVFAGFAHFKHPLFKKITCAITALILIVHLGAVKWHRTYRDELVITCLDVGHGQAIVAQLPGKANVLFDAGSLHKADVGRRIVAPFLDYQGINKLDAIIISHNDVDHINGIPEIAGHCKIRRAYANNAFFDRADKWGTAAFLQEFLIRKKFKIEAVNPSLNLSTPARIKFLWPKNELAEGLELSDNDASLVTLIEFAGKKILLCSDIEQFAQRKLLQLYPGLKADIVVVPHHGSPKTTDPEFLDSLGGEVLICSCAQSQYEKQQRTVQQKTEKFYTHRDGAVTIRIDTDGSLVTTTGIR